ncbi:MAG: hypothetical protein HY706_07025 [Candidatus Hydrogenedentes bacterium]|nr:hypothetical protein [Candidatus Hydrogenedentota bacterium]
MTNRVADLTKEELKELISASVREALEDFAEDLTALSSQNYLASIAEARKDYERGNITRLMQTRSPASKEAS